MEHLLEFVCGSLGGLYLCLFVSQSVYVFSWFMWMPFFFFLTSLLEYNCFTMMC